MSTPRNARRASKTRQTQKKSGVSYTKALREVEKRHAQSGIRPGDILAGGGVQGLAVGDGQMLTPSGFLVDIPAGLSAYQLGEPSVTETAPGDSPPVPVLLRSLGVPDLDTWDPRTTWDKYGSPGAANTPVGIVTGKGEDGGTRHVLHVNIAQSGLIQGMTGTGKSVLLRELVLAGSSANSPERLNLLLVDCKGSVTFKNCEVLPHVVGNVHEIGWGEYKDVHRDITDFVRQESDYRRELLDRAGVASIAEYQKLRSRKAKSRRDSVEPLPSLVIMVEESREHNRSTGLSFRPLMTSCVQNARLGVHLILSDQIIDPANSPYSQWDSSARPPWAMSLRTHHPSRDIVDADASALPAGYGDALFKDWAAGTEATGFRAFNVFGTLDKSLLDRLVLTRPLFEKDANTRIHDSWATILRERERRNTTADGTLEWKDIDLFDPYRPHTAVTGQTGSGYTLLARRLILGAAQEDSGTKHPVVVFTSDTRDNLGGDVQASLEQDSSKIRAWWEALRDHRISVGNERDALPKILIVFHRALTESDHTRKSATDMETEIAALGRELGVHVMHVGTRTPDGRVQSNLCRTFFTASRRETLANLDLRTARLVSRLPLGKPNALVEQHSIEEELLGTELLDFDFSSDGKIPTASEWDQGRAEEMRDLLFEETGVSLP